MKSVVNIYVFALVIMVSLGGFTYADNVEIKLGGGDGFKVQDSNGSALMDILSNGNLGIGNTSPNYKLDVSGDINFTGSLYQNGSIYGGGSGAFTDTGSSAYYTGGNVGIGTTAPATTLDVNGSISSQGPAGEATATAFSAPSGGSTDINSVNNTEFTVLNSVGGGFTASTGVFQPTVAGRYLFTITANSGVSSNWGVSIARNSGGRYKGVSSAASGCCNVANATGVLYLNGTTESVKFQIFYWNGGTATGDNVTLSWTKIP